MLEKPTSKFGIVAIGQHGFAQIWIGDTRGVFHVLARRGRVPDPIIHSPHEILHHDNAVGTEQVTVFFEIIVVNESEIPCHSLSCPSILV